MKLFKKVICTICVCSLILGMSVPYVSASGVENQFNKSLEVTEEEFFAPSPALTTEEIEAIIATDPNAKSTSEVDMIMQSKLEAQKTLSKSTATVAEKKSAREILAFDMHEKVYELQKKSEDELKSLGFDDERIHNIKEFKGTTAELRRILATRTVSGIPTYTKNSSGNWAKVQVFFAWDGVPFWNYTDALLAGANGTFLVQRVAGTTASINYSAFGATGSSDYTKNYGSSSMVINPFSEHLIQGFPFPMAETKILPNGTGISYYAHSGTATFGFKSVTDRAVGLSYGHAHATQSITASLGIDFSGGKPSVGIGFGLSGKYDKTVAGTCDTYTFPA